MRTRTAALLAGCAIAALAAPAAAVELKFGFPAPPMSWVNTNGIASWTKEVEPASGGAVEIKVFAGGSVANFRNVYDRLLNGVIDLAFGTFGEIAHQYRKTGVASLPFEVDNSAEVGVAMWRLYAKGVISDEYQAVKPLAFFAFGMGALHSIKPIAAIDDLDGMKVISSNPLTSRSIQLLGGVPVTMTPAEMYQALQRGLAAATQVSWPGAVVFKIAEVAKHHTDMGFGQGSGYFFMNKDAFAKLPETAQKAIDAASGEKWSRNMGRFATEEEDRSIARILSSPDQQRHKLSKEQEARAKRSLQPIVDDWLKDTPDGERVLAAFRAELKQIRAGM